MLSKLRTFFITCSILRRPEISGIHNNQIILQSNFLLISYICLETKTFVKRYILDGVIFRPNFNSYKKC